MYNDGPITTETMHGLGLYPENLEKRMLQEASPLKYSNRNSGLLSPLTDSHYVKQHLNKVN